ncbi:LrgB-like family-domain-containing protein [Truncatella angustata]|uniref:LrgB-like family-domain-containing protein n=1 Tax=Truncatella angustata TaxID=152316 RepID=A0A9P8ZY88_9PEZI|nr:LrgB-like family-domain-containing protein [Truncatella angustata]KAH6654739.1 LrgB-like family-domain-containing protein [Truncatella angustata]
MLKTTFQSGAKDFAVALKLVARSSWRISAQSWIAVPAGILAMLSACFGVDMLLEMGGVSFPASVACLIILFLALLLSEWVLGEHRTRRFVGYVDISGGWSLRWISIFFTPSFVLLPLSPPIGVIEVFKIIAVFVIGFLLMMVVTAYLTRAIQLASGTSKRTLTERAEELGPQGDEIPMTTTPVNGEQRDALALSPATSSLNLTIPSPAAASQTTSQIRLHDPEPVTPPEANGNGERSELPPQAPPPPSRAQNWALVIVRHLDVLTYSFLFMFVGIPAYYAAGYGMPTHLSIGVLTYFGAIALPAAWRRYLHPVLVSSFATVLIIWVLGLAISRDLTTTLTEYRTGVKYLQLWNGSHELPGAGDILSSVLDASIVALALPMYQYRRELRQHFFAIVTPNILVSIASLFAYPYICYTIGITAERSLAFAARSLTLALATPAVVNLGGDTYTVAAIAIASGIVGVLAGQQILGWLKIPEDDYVTRGVTLGANSSAIATAMLLRTDPRAAALSSLSMGLFGTITVLFTSIPPIANAIRSLVGF